MLQRRPYQSLSPKCLMCRRNQENADCLFIHCDFAYTLWGELLKEFKLGWVFTRGCAYVDSTAKLSLSQKEKEDLDCVDDGNLIGYMRGEK
ncbi:LOW QUALITY PROTEIN: hypothetical protein PanWU01x14_208400 [Parasponia andersonii]|uniref:Reverse transcriptase zinc-binding domain-containing protein n=1 Tax=Parasponia andersonii TaxID=3476 RepID=A0A2P5BUX4_PARAD|nr:LOW QUALITY PROTEIN: hypothetical protein PanWU01x14_208400 [Parasponia andersonii]